MFFAPDCDLAKNWQQVFSFFRQVVQFSGLIGRVGNLRDNPSRGEPFEPIRENVGGNGFGAGQKLLKLVLTKEQ